MSEVHKPQRIRDFDLGDVLSVTTGRLVSPRHITGVYDILGYMTGERLMTHQLPRASDQVKPEILRQHPDLEDVDVPNDLDSEEKVLTWLDNVKIDYGFTRSLVPLVGHVGQDPIEELADMVGPERIIVYPENPVPPR